MDIVTNDNKKIEMVAFHEILNKSSDMSYSNAPHSFSFSKAYQKIVQTKIENLSPTPHPPKKKEWRM